MAESFESWWNGLGRLTQATLVISFFCTLSLQFGMSPYLYVADLTSTFTKLQIWRPITSMVFLGKFGFPWLLGLAMLVMYMKQQEDEHVGRRADFIWMLAIVGSALQLIAFVADMQLLAFAFTMSLVWIWCQRHEDQQLKIYMFTFRAKIFPWALVGFHLLLGQSVFDDLAGIAAGHLYFFLHDTHPQLTGGRSYLETPQWLLRLVPNQRLGVHTVHQAGAPMAAQQPEARRQWGQGRALGRT
jgi:hypothetical protein